ncbi:hypothetical protein NQ315_007742 [Exocentrus adspersus]|uniref:Uncharacterized protein n=1 Tax=Exocentrus adspersus TaxID=1586481 RepID=A0AAV8W8R0_9CUCU|nr:hypothetical protein NQ315_007742 [Exocentrus adspersus]
MHKILLLLFLAYYFVDNISANVGVQVKTLHGNKDPPVGPQKTFVLTADASDGGPSGRQRRAAEPAPATDGIKIKGFPQA